MHFPPGGFLIKSISLAAILVQRCNDAAARLGYFEIGMDCMVWRYSQFGHSDTVSLELLINA